MEESGEYSFCFGSDVCEDFAVDVGFDTGSRLSSHPRTPPPIHPNMAGGGRNLHGSNGHLSNNLNATGTEDMVDRGYTGKRQSLPAASNTTSCDHSQTQISGEGGSAVNTSKPRFGRRAVPSVRDETGSSLVDAEPVVRRGPRRPIEVVGVQVVRRSIDTHSPSVEDTLLPPIKAPFNSIDHRGSNPNSNGEDMTITTRGGRNWSRNESESTQTPNTVSMPPSTTKQATAISLANDKATRSLGDVTVGKNNNIIMNNSNHANHRSNAVRGAVGQTQESTHVGQAATNHGLSIQAQQQQPLVSPLKRRDAGEAQDSKGYSGGWVRQQVKRFESAVTTPTTPSKGNSIPSATSVKASTTPLSAPVGICNRPPPPYQLQPQQQNAAPAPFVRPLAPPTTSTTQQRVSPAITPTKPGLSSPANATNMNPARGVLPTKPTAGPAMQPTAGTTTAQDAKSAFPMKQLGTWCADYQLEGMSDLISLNAHSPLPSTRNSYAVEEEIQMPRVTDMPAHVLTHRFSHPAAAAMPAQSRPSVPRLPETPIPKKNSTSTTTPSMTTTKMVLTAAATTNGSVNPPTSSSAAPSQTPAAASGAAPSKGASANPALLPADARRRKLEKWMHVPVLTIRPPSTVLGKLANATPQNRYVFETPGKPIQEMAGETIELSYDVHNVIVLLRHKNRKLQLGYPEKMPVEVDMRPRGRRPRTPRSFYGKQFPHVGDLWFRDALKDAEYAKSPDFAYLDQMDAEEKKRNPKAGKGLGNHLAAAQNNDSNDNDGGGGGGGGMLQQTGWL